MKKLLLALALCLISTGAFAQCNGVFNPNTICGNLSALPAPPAMVSASGSVLSNFTPSVANNTALKASCTATSGCPSGHLAFPGGVWRLTFGNANGAEPLWYSPSGSPCSIAAGAGDNGLQVQSADSKCWIAQFPAYGASILQFGAIGNFSTDNTTIIQSAVNDLPSNGYNIVAPYGQFCISTGPVIIPASPAGGNSTFINGFSNQSTIFAACNNNVTLFEWEGQGGGLSNVALFCRGSSSTDTFSFNKPCLAIHGGAENTFTNLNIEGGYGTIFLDGGANSDRFYNIFAFNSYGPYNIGCQNCSNISFTNSTLDQSWPVAPLTSANISSFGAWASGQAYAANKVVSITSSGVVYYIQCVNCNGVTTSSGSAPLVKPYNATITNGSDGLNWNLVAPQTYAGVQCDTSCGEIFLQNVDLAGPYSGNFLLTNTLSGTAPTGVLFNNVTTSFNIGTVFQLVAGSGVQITGGSISGCAITGCAGVSTTSAYTGGTQINGEFIGGVTTGLVDGAGTQFEVTENIIDVNACFLTGTSVTQFIFSHNFCPNQSGAITIGTSSDIYAIMGNITGNTTQNANVTNNGGSHGTISGNW